MTQSNTLVPPLVCPLDQSLLTEQKGKLTCCNGHEWDIKQGIPRMIIQQGDYTDAFGLQWTTYQKTQLDSYTETTISEDRLRRCLGETLWHSIHDHTPITVLETGCGAGRFSEVLLKSPSVYLTSTDYSIAVEANQANCPQSDRHRVIQADLLAAPFEKEQYDVVICLGVVQHTPNTEETLEKLYEQVKPGGWLIFDHYTFMVSRLTRFSALLIRPILKNMSPDAGLQWTERIVNLFYPLHAAVRKAPLLETLLSFVSPVLTYFQDYPELSDELKYEWSLLDTHDYLTDYYKHMRTKEQLVTTMQELGSADLYCEYDGNGLEARCRKPHA